MNRKSIVWGVICVGAGVVLAVVTGVLWGLGVWDSGPGALDGDDDVVAGTVERHFLEQMIPHHEDAVAMAELALIRAEHPELKRLAETIIDNQTREIEQMRAWYRSWYGVRAPAYDRDDLGGSGGFGPMMGGRMMATVDLAVLEAASVFDKEFIEQMIPHHQMGVMMARMVLSRSDRPEIEELARAIITTQTGEIVQMRDLYETWYR